WYKPISHMGYGMSDYQNNLGIDYYLNLINMRLIENLSQINNFYLLDANKYFLNVKKIYNNKMWYTTKTPYSLDVIKKVKRDIDSSIEGLLGKSRRLIVLDLDNTLWGGILGDVGWEGVKIGGHDYLGEAFAEFQKVLKSLTNRGLLLAIASKNYEDVALEAIEKNPEMILKKDDFSSWKINWQDKAQNIVDITKDVNLGLSSVIFIDDNQAERARVAEALPDVFVPDWPENPVDYKEALLLLDCFNTPSVTKEDRQRSKMFVQNRERKDLSSMLSHNDWLKSIEMIVEIEKFNSTNSSRTVQLLNKTNQFNLATRRMSESEFADWNEQTNNEMFTFKVKDKFGDLGLTGVISFSIDDTNMIISDFIMSCRVMGREIERLMLGYIISKAQEIGLKQVIAKYIKTDRNKPMYEFLNNSGFEKDGDIYSWSCDKTYEIPSFITLQEAL
ncbi:MAG: HAD-IIIC family phosphatase, partial [Campylobacterales bacterium]|nr:HAD-IIIC family phosphatase [Campylobacterales bacterium]